MRAVNRLFISAIFAGTIGLATRWRLSCGNIPGAEIHGLILGVGWGLIIYSWMK
ncbi:hypothetical protein [Neobacillus notoginsengisoli]|uniref:hypothetical protein n=1 Tax=Neobacillus notoginsengisoli TaxID=1578198 RepID=UPI001313ECA0|nr:hypothetical protein [Neobacillus notoginsengisoli]